LASAAQAEPDETPLPSVAATSLLAALINRPSAPQRLSF